MPVRMLVGEHNGLRSIAWAGFEQDSADVAVDCLLGHPTSLGAFGVRRSARHQYKQLVFAWRELLEQRRRLERIDARSGAARRAGVDPRRLVEVAVVGLPARAARLDLDGRLRQRRQLELGRVEDVHRFCLVLTHRWRTRIPSRSTTQGKIGCDPPQVGGSPRSADPAPDVCASGSVGQRARAPRRGEASAGPAWLATTGAGPSRAPAVH